MNELTSNYCAIAICFNIIIWNLNYTMFRQKFNCYCFCLLELFLNFFRLMKLNGYDKNKNELFSIDEIR